MKIYVIRGQPIFWVYLLKVGWWVAQTRPFINKLHEIINLRLLQQSQYKIRFWICLWVLTFGIDNVKIVHALTFSIAKKVFS